MYVNEYPVTYFIFLSLSLQQPCHRYDAAHTIRHNVPWEILGKIINRSLSVNTKYLFCTRVRFDMYQTVQWKTLIIAVG